VNQQQTHAVATTRPRLATRPVVLSLVQSNLFLVREVEVYKQFSINADIPYLYSIISRIGGEFLTRSCAGK
jgi:hypothetical protein